jgi:hypothetical protein
MVRSHNLAEPTEAAAIESIGRVVGVEQAKATWQRAREGAGFKNGATLSLSDLMSVADELSRFDGFLGVMGTALRIRIQTYRILDEQENPSQQNSAQTDL